MQQSMNDLMKSSRDKHVPPGRLKITQALKTLLEHKEFNGITTAEISRRAGVTEALIYKYFLIVGIFICPQGLGLFFSPPARHRSRSGEAGGSQRKK